MQFDVAIIGGGIVGCAAAYYLSKSGASVVILEQEQLNQGASGRNAGSLHFQLEHRFLREDKSHWDVLAHLLPLNRLAVDLWTNIEDELKCNLEVKLKGGFMVAETHDQVELLKRKHALERKCGIDTEIISGAETREFCPMLSEKIIASSYLPTEGSCNPRFVTTALAKVALNKGAQIRTNSRVIAINRANKYWRISIKPDDSQTSLSRTTIKAKTILNAANAAADEITSMVNYHLPIFRHNLTISVTEKVPFSMSYMLQHVARKLSLKQVRDGGLIIGGGWPAKLNPKPDSQNGNSAAIADVDSIIGNMRAALAVLPAIKNAHLLRSWAGSTSDTTDQLPVLGPIQNIPDFYIATGGNGVTYALAYAKLMSEQILTGSCVIDIDAFSPNRFNSSGATNHV